MVIFVSYVDDLLIIGDEHVIKKCKQDLSAEFEMKDLGLLHYFLGLEIWQLVKCIILNQGKYIANILNKYGMTECKPTATPMEINLHKLKDDLNESKYVDLTYYR